MGTFLKKTNVSTGPLGRRMIAFVEKYYPAVHELYITSAYRPNESGSHHSGLWYKGSRTAAVDFGAYDDSEPNSKDQRDMGLFADWLFKHFWDLTVELIHTQPHNDHFTYVKDQRKVGAYATAAHVNHIHWATSHALMDKIEARAKKKWGKTKPTEPKPSQPPTKFDNTESPIFGCDVYDFTVNDGLNEAAIREMVGRGGLKFINAKIAEVASDGSTWVHTKALRMLNAAKDAGVEFPMGFVVPRTGVSPATLMRVAEKALDQHCPWWRTHPTFSFQVDTEHWGNYDHVSLNKGVAVAKYIRDNMKRRVAAVYAPDWAYESTDDIGKIHRAGFGWWASEYAGSGASRNYRDMYNGAGGSNAPGWRVVDGVKPVLNQFCSDGRVPGYGGHLVMTAFNGTAHEFAQYLGANTEEEKVAKYSTVEKVFRKFIKTDSADGGKIRFGPLARNVFEWVRRNKGNAKALGRVEAQLAEMALQVEETHEAVRRLYARVDAVVNSGADIAALSDLVDSLHENEEVPDGE